MIGGRNQTIKSTESELHNFGEKWTEQKQKKILIIIIKTKTTEISIHNNRCCRSRRGVVYNSNN